MQKSKREEDFADVEDALMQLRPMDLSEQFYASVEAKLAQAEDDSSAEEPANVIYSPRGRTLIFSLRRAAASAALVLCVIGLGVWGYSVLPGSAEGGVPAVVNGAAMASAGGLPLAASTCGAKENSPLARNRNLRRNFNLVNVERRMAAMRPQKIVAKDDGRIVRTIKYSYVDEYHWEDEGKSLGYVELRPHEEVISQEMSIY